jgi:hypothetical protein
VCFNQASVWVTSHCVLAFILDCLCRQRAGCLHYGHVISHLNDSGLKLSIDGLTLLTSNPPVSMFFTSTSEERESYVLINQSNGSSFNCTIIGIRHRCFIDLTTPISAQRFYRKALKFRFQREPSFFINLRFVLTCHRRQLFFTIII